MRKAPIATAVALSCVLIGQVLVLSSSYASAPTRIDNRAGAHALPAEVTSTDGARPSTRVRPPARTKPAARPHANRPKPNLQPKVEHRARPHTAQPSRAASPAAKSVPARSQPVATTHRAPAGPTSWPALNAAIARIPGYHAGDARWVIKSSAHWGTADWYDNTIYLSHSVPDSKVYDVVLHEWSHLLTVRAYGGNVDAAVAATTRYFGGKGLMGSEYAADCMARVLGAHWTNYTSCGSATWRSAARRLVEGKHLPS